MYLVHCTIVHLYSKVATFEPELSKCTLYTTLVLKSCDLTAGAAKMHLVHCTCTEKLLGQPVCSVYYNCTEKSRPWNKRCPNNAS